MLKEKNSYKMRRGNNKSVKTDKNNNIIRVRSEIF